MPPSFHKLKHTLSLVQRRTINTTAPRLGPQKRHRPKVAQNLSERYLRLEKSLRGKQAYSADLRESSVSRDESSTSMYATSGGGGLGASSMRPPRVMGPVTWSPGVGSSMGSGTLGGKKETRSTTTTTMEKGGSDIPRMSAASASTSSVPIPSTPANSKPPVETFRGFTIPKEPVPPADDECCMSGCAVCVYDLHDEAMESYTQALTSLRSSLSSLGVPEEEWPASIRLVAKTNQNPITSGPTSTNAPPSPLPQASSTTSASSSRKEAVLSAFEEMERWLAERKRSTGTGDECSNPASPTISTPESPTSIPGPSTTSTIYTTSFTNTDTKTTPSAGNNVVGSSPSSESLDGPAKGQAQKRKRKKKSNVPTMSELYEGLRWVLFSHR